MGKPDDKVALITGSDSGIGGAPTERTRLRRRSAPKSVGLDVLEGSAQPR